MSRTYPFKAWVLMPSFKPVEVEIVSEYRSWNKEVYHQTAKQKTYTGSDLFGSKDEAICAGRKRLADQEADLAKRAENIAKKRAALDKAESQQ